MSFDYCASCKHVFTKIGEDIPHADGGVMEVIHHGGVCRNCYLTDGVHRECKNCKSLGFLNDKFCKECGIRNENIMVISYR